MAGVDDHLLDVMRSVVPSRGAAAALDAVWWQSRESEEPCAVEPVCVFEVTCRVMVEPVCVA